MSDPSVWLRQQMKQPIIEGVGYQDGGPHRIKARNINFHVASLNIYFNLLLELDFPLRSMKIHASCCLTQYTTPKSVLQQKV